MPARTRKPATQRPTGRQIAVNFGAGDLGSDYDQPHVTPFASQAIVSAILNGEGPCPPLLASAPTKELAERLLTASGASTVVLKKILNLPKWEYCLAPDMLEQEWRTDARHDRAPVLRYFSALVYFCGGSIDAEGQPILSKENLAPWAPVPPAPDSVEPWTPPVVVAEKPKTDTRTGGLVERR
jgi:hypothetical protein